MPGEPTTAGANKALDALTGRATQTAATTYLALFTSVPTDAGGGTEMTTAGYARQVVTWTAPSGDPALSENSNDIAFGPFSADPPLIAYCALFTALTGGTMLYFWTLTTSIDALTDDSIYFVAGDLEIRFD